MRKIVGLALVGMLMAGCVAYVDPIGPGAYIGLPPLVVAPPPVVIAPHLRPWGWHGGWHGGWRGQGGGWHHRGYHR